LVPDKYFAIKINNIPTIYINCIDIPISRCKNYNYNDINIIVSNCTEHCELITTVEEND